MRINLKKRILHTHLILGLVWLTFGSMYFLITSDSLFWFGFGFMAIGFFDILHYLYDSKHQYLHIENGSIRKNKLYGFNFTTKIDVDDIHEIKRAGGNYILKSESSTFKIDPAVIEKESLNDLHNFLKELNSPSEKTFLTR
ncbi:hypothetical protein LB450_07475 [Psychroflexus sp. CAK1W]|uniref:hypothetical protein n=1 Tax=Psychroflexus curvus TaxID=2873595 RepID=UPI001CCBFD1F|nr:hypothetical protein [Psychroflexus curvus]MBZ9627937.1 hypothetical protein [Psychroflexus curvus]